MILITYLCIFSSTKNPISKITSKQQVINKQVNTKIITITIKLKNDNDRKSNSFQIDGNGKENE